MSAVPLDCAINGIAGKRAHLSYRAGICKIYTINWVNFYRFFTYSFNERRSILILLYSIALSLQAGESFMEETKNEEVPDVLCFYGPTGSSVTTLARMFCHALQLAISMR